MEISGNFPGQLRNPSISSPDCFSYRRRGRGVCCFLDYTGPLGTVSTSIRAPYKNIWGRPKTIVDNRF